MTRKILLCFLLFSTMLFGQQQWRSIGPDDFEQASYGIADYNPIAFDSNNIPYIAFDNNGYGEVQHTLTIRKFVDGYWQTVGTTQVFPTGIQDIDLEIDNNDVPYFCYSTQGSNYNTFVRKFNGTNWENVGSISPASSFSKLAFNSQNELYIAGSFGSSWNAGVKKFNGTSWVAVGQVNASANGTNAISFCFDQNDVPYIAYSDVANNNKINVRKLNANVWENVGPANFSTHDAAYINVKIDNNNIPYVAYQDNYYFSSAKRAIVKKFNGSTWENVGTGNASPVTAYDVSFVIDDNNIPIISYADTSGINVRSFNGTVWTNVGSAFNGNQTQIRVNDNAIYVGFCNKVVGVRRFNGNFWEMLGPTDISDGRTEDNAGGLDRYMDISSDNTIYAAYTDEMSLKAVVKKWNGSSWEILGYESLQDANVNVQDFKVINDSPYIYLKPSAYNSATLKRFDGTAWVNALTSGNFYMGTTAEANGNSSSYSRQKFVVDDNNTIYSIARLTTEYDDYIKVKKNTGSGWVSIGSWVCSNATGNFDIALGPDNLPCIIYFDNSDIPVLKKLNVSGSGWQTLASLPYETRSPQLKFGSQGNLYIAYTANISGEFTGVDIQKYNGSALEFVGSIVSSEAVYNFKFALDNNDIPYITYYGEVYNFTAAVKKLNGISGEFVGNSISASIMHESPFIGFDSDNNPIVGLFSYGIFAKYFGEVNPAYRLALDFINLQGPATLTLSQGQNGTIYARTSEPGVTETDGESDHVISWIGISSENSHPSTWTTWIPATYNNDEYIANIGSTLTPGTYYYASRFKLDDGPYTYGGYSADGGGYWNGVTNISGMLTVNCTAAAPTLIAEQELCSGSTIADINTENTEVIWYNSATSSTPLPETTVLANGQYFASQISGGCESTARTVVTVTVTSTPVPLVSENTQTFCGTATVADLTATGTSLKWYNSITGGNQLQPAISLTPGNYYVSQTINGCESTRALVEVIVNTTPAPSAIQSNQTFCNYGTVSDLEVDGSNILWYTLPFEGTAIEENSGLSNNTVYYASQTINGCESSERVAVMVQINEVNSPQGENVQQINVGTAIEATLEDIIVAGISGDIHWYLTMEDAIASENEVPTTTQLTTGSTYFATQTIDGCTSESVFWVTANVLLGNNTFDINHATCYPNPANNIITISSPVEIKSITIFNLLGQQLMAREGDSPKMDMDISGLANGNYIVQVQASEKTQIFKVIKQ